MVAVASERLRIGREGHTVEIGRPVVQVFVLYYFRFYRGIISNFIDQAISSLIFIFAADRNCDEFLICTELDTVYALRLHIITHSINTREFIFNGT